MKKLEQFFNGKLSLAQSFWIWLVLANLAFQLAIMLLGQLGLFLTYLLFISKIVYEVFAIIGVWRSATNYIKKKKTVYWGWLAKISAIGYALEVLVFTYILLVPAIGDFKAQNFKPKKEPAPQVRIEPEKKQIKEIKDVILECTWNSGDKFSVVFNDKTRILSDDGQGTTILEWNKDLIRYSHNVGGYDHTHTLNRITGRVDGEAICFKSYGRAF